MDFTRRAAFPAAGPRLRRLRRLLVLVALPLVLLGLLSCDTGDLTDEEQKSLAEQEKRRASTFYGPDGTMHPQLAPDRAPFAAEVAAQDAPIQIPLAERETDCSLTET